MLALLATLLCLATPDPADRPEAADLGHPDGQGREHQRHDGDEKQPQEHLPDRLGDVGVHPPQPGGHLGRRAGLDEREVHGAPGGGPQDEAHQDAGVRDRRAGGHAAAGVVGFRGGVVRGCCTTGPAARQLAAVPPGGGSTPLNTYPHPRPMRPNPLIATRTMMVSLGMRVGEARSYNCAVTASTTPFAVIPKCS